MSCACETYVCLEILHNPCSEGALLPIEATETGTWTALIEFNGTWLSQSFDVTDGEDIVVNNVFNPGYTHLVKIYDSSGGLLANTCYKVSIIGTTDATYTPELSDGMEIQPALDFTTDSGTTLYQDDLLIGAEIISIELEGLPYTVYSFDDETGTITIPLNLPVGGTMRVLYKK